MVGLGWTGCGSAVVDATPGSWAGVVVLCESVGVVASSVSPGAVAAAAGVTAGGTGRLLAMGARGLKAPAPFFNMELIFARSQY